MTSRRGFFASLLGVPQSTGQPPLVLLVLLVLACTAYPQTTLTLVGPLSIGDGESAGLQVVVTSPHPQLAGLQWTVCRPPTATVTITPGPASTAANKTLACDSLYRTCLVYGINADVIGPGVVALVRVTVPTGARRGPMGLTGLVAADLLGNEIPLPPPPPHELQAK